jgi:hypothetical protein
VLLGVDGVGDRPRHLDLPGAVLTGRQLRDDAPQGRFGVVGGEHVETVPAPADSHAAASTCEHRQVGDERSDRRPTGPEADGTGPTSVTPASSSSAALLRLQRAAGNRATLAALGGTEPPTPTIRRRPVIQRRWLVDQHSSRYFWEEDGTPKGAPPAELSTIYGFTEIPPMAPGTYSTASGRGARRPGVRPVSTADDFMRENPRSARPAAPHDRYNPWGRFADVGFVSHVVNSHGAMTSDQRTALHTSLAQHPKFKDWTSAQGRRADGYPDTVTLSDGTVLSWVSTDEFGASYAQTPQPAASAASSGPVAAPLVLTPGPAPSLKSARTMLTADIIRRWAGVTTRTPSQIGVMGQSAAAVAANAGYPAVGWEWLHLIAHSMGGIAGQPQQAPNLVVGTEAANAQMIIVEEALKDYVLTTGGTVHISVLAPITDPDRHIASSVQYDFAFLNAAGAPLGVQSHRFDPMSTSVPGFALNRSFRVGVRTAYTAATPAASAYTFGSGPSGGSGAPDLGPDGSAHRDPIDAQVDALRGAYVHSGPAAVVHQVVELAKADRLEAKWVFSSLSEIIHVDDVLVIARSLAQLPIDAPLRHFLQEILRERRTVIIAPHLLKLLRSEYGTGMPAWIEALFARYLGGTATAATAASSSSPPP